MEVGKEVIKRGDEDLSFVFVLFLFLFLFVFVFCLFVCLFFFLLFTFENDENLFWVYQNGNFLPGIHARKKI